jgi:hypothetical protein
MKIWLLTYHFSDNFGALMQAYALRQWFIKNGCVADFFPYQPVHVEEGGSFKNPFLPSNFRANVTILYMKITRCWGSIFGSKHQHLKFRLFRAQHLGVAKPRLFSGDQLRHEIADGSMLVCGSDQIWAPSVQYGVDPVYFLDFPGAESCRRISYAASFGRSSLQAIYSKQVGKLLNGLDAISVRESTGADIVKQCSGRDALVVPDPTVLLGDFSPLVGNSVEQGDHIFCYALRSDEIIRDVAECVSSTLELPLISARNSRQRWRDIGQGFSPGPVDWLKCLLGAKFVVTNSFHGVALAVIHNKPFIAVSLPVKKDPLNARAINLLSSTGLMDRFVRSSEQSVIEPLLSRQIDWSRVNQSLQAQRAVAENYLFEQIQKAKEVGN